MGIVGDPIGGERAYRAVRRNKMTSCLNEVAAEADIALKAAGLAMPLFFSVPSLGGALATFAGRVVVIFNWLGHEISRQQDVQQSGMGQIGSYGRLRSFGPTAQAFSGLSDMSGLPEPFPPAGIGYSYLDWFGAYQMALAMMAALYRQKQTGKGC